MFTRAIARKPGPDFAQGITRADLGAPDFQRLLDQHTAYLALLGDLGLEVEVLADLPGHPDAYFVEDVAVVTPQVAVITRPGATARRGEIETMAPVLARYRPTVRMPAPGTLDGGDVLRVGNHCFIGVSSRTNAEGARFLGETLARHGGTWDAIPVPDGLHLKCGVTWAGGETLLLTRTFMDRPEFSRFQRLLVAPEEEYAANTLWINGHLIVPAGFPRTRAQLERLGLPVHELDTSEARKMDGALTCLSLRF